MNKRIKKFLVIGAILSIGISGVVYASKEIRTTTQTAETWDKITGDWVNAVNKQVNASGGGGMWPWTCFSNILQQTATIYITCTRPDNTSVCVREISMNAGNRTVRQWQCRVSKNGDGGFNYILTDIETLNSTEQQFIIAWQ